MWRSAKEFLGIFGFPFLVPDFKSFINTLTLYVGVHPAPTCILLDFRHDMKLKITPLKLFCKRKQQLLTPASPTSKSYLNVSFTNIRLKTFGFK